MLIYGLLQLYCRHVRSYPPAAQIRTAVHTRGFGREARYVWLFMSVLDSRWAHDIPPAPVLQNGQVIQRALPAN